MFARRCAKIERAHRDNPDEATKAPRTGRWLQGRSRRGGKQHGGGKQWRKTAQGSYFLAKFSPGRSKELEAYAQGFINTILGLDAENTSDGSNYCPRAA